jgi:hypothetical protein
MIIENNTDKNAQFLWRYNIHSLLMVYFFMENQILGDYRVGFNKI